MYELKRTIHAAVHADFRTETRRDSLTSGTGACWFGVVLVAVLRGQKTTPGCEARRSKLGHWEDLWRPLKHTMSEPCVAMVCFLNARAGEV